MIQYIFKSIVATALVSTLVIGCRREMESNLHSPAYHIHKSEKLDIPAAIAIPSNPKENLRVATFFAEGVQKYKAQQKPASDPAIYEWVFVAPQADLYDDSNKKVGTHSAGPSWQLFGSSDSIFAQQFSPARTAASPDPSSIDWLLLMPKTGKTPTGIFTNVYYIQRIATQGGKAPTRLPVNANETAEVKYTAVYRFSKKN